MEEHEYTYEDIEGLLENVTVRKDYEDGVFYAYELFPHKGYVLHTVGDNGHTTDNGDFIPPYYTYYIMTGFDDDLNRFEAIFITPDMKINGEPIKL